MKRFALSLADHKCGNTFRNVICEQVGTLKELNHYHTWLPYLITIGIYTWHNYIGASSVCACASISWVAFYFAWQHVVTFFSQSTTTIKVTLVVHKPFNLPGSCLPVPTIHSLIAAIIKINLLMFLSCSGLASRWVHSWYGTAQLQ